MKYKECLERQLKESYGKITYSYTCHWEEIVSLRRQQRILDMLEIPLTVFSATGFFGVLFVNRWFLNLISCLSSSISLAIVLYAKGKNYNKLIESHQNTADELWLIRENYISILTDIDMLDETEIIRRRDELCRVTSSIYKIALPTSKKAYAKAQNQLKNKEYQYFEDEELNQMLPKHLRK